MSTGRSSLLNSHRRSVANVDKILKGAEPADLARRAADEVRAGDRRKDRAKALGLTIPQSLLQRADEVIQ